MHEAGGVDGGDALCDGAQDVHRREEVGPGAHQPLVQGLPGLVHQAWRQRVNGRAQLPRRRHLKHAHKHALAAATCGPACWFRGADRLAACKLVTC